MSKRVSRHPSEETRRRMSESKKGHLNPRWKVKVSATTRHRISDSLRRHWSKIPKT